MSVLHRPDERVRVDVDGAVYWVRVPSHYDPGDFQRACQRAGLHYWSDLEMLEVTKRGVRECVEAPAERDELLEALEHVAAGLATGEPVDEAALDRAANIEDAVCRTYPPARYRRADRTQWRANVVRVAARFFAVARGEPPEDLPRDDDDGLSWAAFNDIPRAHIDAIGHRALALLAPSAGEAKN